MVVDKNDLTLDRLVEGMLEAMRDPRVAGAVQRDLLADLKRVVEDGFAEEFARRTAEEAREAGVSVPAGTPLDEILRGLADHEPDLIQKAADAIAAITGRFLHDRRADVIASMQAAGEGPVPGREARLADAATRIDQAVAAASAALAELGTLSATTEAAGAASQAIAPAVEALEAVREVLAVQELDDALLLDPPPNRPAGPDEGQGEGERRSGLAPDLEALVLRAWTAEAELDLEAAQRVGPPVGGEVPGTFEQESFLLDGIVALQEALQVRSEAGVAILLARFRYAKGDMGEARALCERILELPRMAERHDEARVLLDRVSKSSPLAGKGRCFIATAAMGGENAPEVQVLRRLRDEVLQRHAGGRAFVTAYYRLSPPIAERIAKSPLARSIVRTLVVEPLAHVALQVVGRRAEGSEMR